MTAVRSFRLATGTHFERLVLEMNALQDFDKSLQNVPGRGGVGDVITRITLSDGTEPCFFRHKKTLRETCLSSFEKVLHWSQWRCETEQNMYRQNDG